MPRDYVDQQTFPHTDGGSSTDVVVIVAQQGSGKSFALQTLYEELIENHKAVPVPMTFN